MQLFFRILFYLLYFKILVKNLDNSSFYYPLGEYKINWYHHDLHPNLTVSKQWDPHKNNGFDYQHVWSKDRKQYEVIFENYVVWSFYNLVILDER